MKKMLAVLVILSLCLVMVAACGNGDNGDNGGNGTGPAPGEDGITEIRLASHNAIIEGNPYRIRYEADIREAAEDAINYGFRVHYASFVSNWDAAIEAQHIRNSINEGYHIILVNPVAPSGMDPLIESAQEAGIIWINADCIYESPYVDILNIATDQFYLGYRTATEAGRALGPGGRVVMLAALDGNVANTDRQRGFEQGVQEQGLVIVAGGNHNWDPALSTQVMTEILNSGVEFDGVLVSQVAENALTAFDNVGRDYPRFMGFNDTGEWMQRMFNINADGRVMDFLVLSNPPGVGATALNFGLNILLGREIRTELFDDPALNSILIPPRIAFTFDNMEDYRDLAFGMAPGDAITFWLTVDEVATQFFR